MKTGYENTNESLKEATGHFLHSHLRSPGFQMLASDKSQDASRVLAMRIFHEGAFWMCWRIFDAIEKQRYAKNDLLAILTSVMADHAEVREICEGRIRGEEH